MNTAALEIRDLSPERLADFLVYFDREAFADNPQWASCYCQHLYVDHAQVNWASRTAQDNRAAACERICSGRMHGLLAYRDGQPVGWCNAAPRMLLDAFADEPDPDAERLGQITCFVVAKAHRRTGVATALLDTACDRLKRLGLAIAEAAPRTAPDSDAHAYHGTLGMYLAAGFHVHRDEQDGTVLVRRALR